MMVEKCKPALRGFILAFAISSIGGAQIGKSQESGPGTNATTVPAFTHLALLAPDGDHTQISKPFRHSRGESELEREKQDAELLASSPVTALAGPLAPSIGIGYDAISFQESFCNCIPPDGSVSAGPNHVIGLVNTAFKIWNKTGTVLAGPISLQSFFSVNPNSLPNISDPSTLYDSVSNRFIIEALTYDSNNNSSITIAVSLTGDPTTSWYIYTFPASPAGNLLDFPHPAVGSDAIYLGVNQFQNGVTFTGARVYAYNKAQMYSGAAASYIFFNVGNTATGIQADSLWPAQGVGVAGAEYFIGMDNCNCSTVSVWKLRNPFGTSSFTLTGGVNVTPYTEPPNAAQLGGRALATNDTAVLGAFWYNNTLYGTHTVGVNPGSGTVAGIHWFQLSNLDAAPTLVQQGTIAGNGQYRYFPNLAVDSHGNMGIAYAYSSGSDYAGIRYTGRLATDPLNTVQSESVLKAGEATVVNNSRYGDFAGTVVDPDGSTFWHLEEYAKAGSVWGTWIGSFSITPGTPDFSIGASPSSQTVAPGGSTSYTVTLTALNGYNSSVSLSVSGLPAGATASFSPGSATPTSAGATSTLNITTASGTAAASYGLTITGTGTDGTIHSTGVTLTVRSTTSDFSMSASPSSRTVSRGSRTRFAVGITSVNGYNVPVTLAVSGLPSGATASFSPNPITPTSGGVSSTLTISAGGSAQTGTFPLTITGAGSDGTRHTANVSLTITTGGRN